MEPGIVQRIFRDGFESYRAERAVSERERRAAWNIMTCRTRQQGFHVDECPNGDYRVLLHNSCKHRSCPQCGGTETELWLERRRRQALSCRYFHIVFTISHELHGIWRFNRKVFTDLMLRAAWDSLRELLGDERWLGAFPGALGVFQSWDDEMQEHCHLHFIVTAGGLDSEGQWKEADGDFLLPTPVLASKFRGKFLAYLRERFNKVSARGKSKLKDRLLVAPEGMSVQQCLNLLNKLGRKRWHADIEPAYEHAEGVYKYVGRYLRRGPISEKRIVAYDGESVTISYAHPEKHGNRTFRVKAETFIGRLLKHVPEKGTHVVRSYGLFHANCRGKLNEARAQLHQPKYEPLTDLPDAHELLLRMFPDWEGNLCPRCGAMLRTVHVYHRGQAPPLRMAA
ncbi:MAG: transposase [Chloroflexota bacterium]